MLERPMLMLPSSSGGVQVVTNKSGLPCARMARAVWRRWQDTYETLKYFSASRVGLEKNKERRIKLSR